MHMHHILSASALALVFSSALVAEEFNAHQDPKVSGINRLPARTTLYSFTDEGKAATHDRAQSSRLMTLNGKWDFAWYPKPADVPARLLSGSLSRFRAIGK